MPSSSPVSLPSNELIATIYVSASLTFVSPSNLMSSLIVSPVTKVNDPSLISHSLYPVILSYSPLYSLEFVSLISANSIDTLRFKIVTSISSASKS